MFRILKMSNGDNFWFEMVLIKYFTLSFGSHGIKTTNRTDRQNNYVNECYLFSL